MSEFELAQQFAQECISKAPVIILGSGASAAHNIPGMQPLANHLKLEGPPVMDGGEMASWNEFVARLATDDLETALTHISMSERLTAFIVNRTRTFLTPYDTAVFHGLLSDRQALPLSRLFRHIFTSTNRTVDVITPNYDRIAEYAANAAGYPYYTGFTSGYLGTRSGPFRPTDSAARTVCVWKVHGSLDWFKDEHHQSLCVPACADVPVGHQALMITPGIEKYRTAYNEPFRTIISCADRALEHARAYLCIGFGFNDDHLQTKLVERCDEQSVPIVVITKHLTETARSFLFGGRCRRFVAIEKGPTGTRFFTHDNEVGFDIPSVSYWKLSDFLDLAIGVDR